MKKFIGTKEVQATPMNLGEFIEYSGRNPYANSEDMHGNDEPGYLVKYKDGYESWSPKGVFESSYREVGNEKIDMDFGDAIQVLKQGGVIRRKGWNGKNICVFKQVPAHIESNIIPNMQSLPATAKHLILDKGTGHIDYTSQCLIYNTETGRADSWVPSISDVFAEDWEIVS